MTGLRRTDLPIEHLEAELLAAPFVSPVAFGAALTSLSPMLSGSGGGTGALWRDIECDLLSRFAGMSVDELVMRRDRVWYRAAANRTSGPVPLARVLRCAAHVLVDIAAGAPRIRRDGDTEERVSRRRWRWMSFALPPDLLLAAAGASQERLEQISPALVTVLRDRGYAETHLHLKAAIVFPTLWISLMRVLAERTTQPDLLKSPGAQLREGRDLAPWLLRVALARLLLAGFLRNRTWRMRGFGAYLREHALPGISLRFGLVSSALLRRGLRELMMGRFEVASPSFGALRDLYGSLTGVPVSRSSDDVSWLDPLSWWFPPGVDASPEFRLMQDSLAYLEEPNAVLDPVFARIFWQTVRVRVFFYRHVVQRPLTPGLQWFTRTYARLGPARRALGLATFVREAARLGGPGLRSLEVRITPEDGLLAMSRVVETFDRACGALATDRITGPIEAGLVIHFSRTRGPDIERGLPSAWGTESNEQPDCFRLNPTGYRFGGYYVQRRREAAALGGLFLTFPRMLERVRGVDLCTDELGIPLWVVLPLVRYVRAAAGQANMSLRTASRTALPPLRTTVHAGEDFVHLVGGLRRVAESVEFLQMGEGDRIGHGVALGVDVEAWAARSTGLTIPRGERLLDLIWIWRTTVRASEDSIRTWLPWIDQEMRRLGRIIFDHTLTALQLAEWSEALHTNRALRAARFPGGPPVQTILMTSADSLVSRWLTDPVIFRRSQDLEDVDVAREVALVRALQVSVCTLLARRGIVIELNPSSNLLTGNLGDLRHHPLWRLCPPPGYGSGAPSLRVCIGSDDPITFATQLPEEYQLLHDAMVEGGVSAHDADAWIDAARAHGLAARFTVRRSEKSLKSPMFLATLPVRP